MLNIMLRKHPSILKVYVKQFLLTYVTLNFIGWTLKSCVMKTVTFTRTMAYRSSATSSYNFTSTLQKKKNLNLYLSEYHSSLVHAQNSSYETDPEHSENFIFSDII